MPEQTIIYGDLQVLEYPDLLIRKLRVQQELNSHGTLTFLGVIEEEQLEQYTNRVFSDQVIHINNKQNLMFCGIITSAKIEFTDGIYQFYVTALTHTDQMDREVRCRSFQNPSLTYAQVISQVLSAYPGAVFLDPTTNQQMIGAPVIQYQETDWQFLKRLASHFHVALVPNQRGQQIRFSFGLPEIDRGDLCTYDYCLEKEFDSYQRRATEIPDCSEAEFTFFEVETAGIYDLGDRITYQQMGKDFYPSEQYIIKTIFEYDQAVVKNRCRLGFKKGATVAEIAHQKLAGCSIFGEVLAVSRDHVKLHLEIDQQQSVAEAYWYPYASMYASKEETGWYCMPEVGDTVRLYHPEASEQRAMAISSVKPHDPQENLEQLDSSHRMADSNVKYLRTAFGKEIKFRPNGIDLIAKDGTVFMSLNDDGSVYLNSNNKISFTAMNEIEMKATNVNIQALEHITLQSKQSSIDLEEDIVIKGKEVKTN